jgi:hypothetical protein
MSTIFVTDGVDPRASQYDLDQGHTVRERNLGSIKEYLYGGSRFVGWGSDPCGKVPGTGFLFDVPDHSGFGPDQTLDRLASGLHYGHRCAP